MENTPQLPNLEEQLTAELLTKIAATETVDGKIDFVQFINDTLEKSPEYIATFATNDAVDALIAIASDLASDEGMDYAEYDIDDIISSIAEAIRKIATDKVGREFLSTEAAVNALIAIGKTAERVNVLEAVAIAMVVVLEDNHQVQIFFSTQEVADTLIAMANKIVVTDDEDEMEENDDASENIANVITRITMDNPDSQEFFATDEMVVALAKMAREGRASIVRKTVAETMISIAGDDEDAWVMFAVPEIVDVVIRMACEAEYDQEINNVANIIKSLTEHDLTLQQLFASPESIEAFLIMIERYESEDTKEVIDEAIINICISNPALHMQFAAGEVRVKLLKLNAACQQYEANNPDEPKIIHLKSLLFRFLTQNAEERGGIEIILSPVSPVLEAFTQNPNHLKWAEKIAGEYLDGCVNQPVAGWSEICAVTSIAQAPKIIDKIEAAKHLMALEAIKDFISKLPADQKPGEAVEVEAGNSLLMRIHERLLTDNLIAEPWQGVPEIIAYQDTVKSWLTPERFAKSYRAVRDSLQDSGWVANLLCEGLHKDTWGEIAFPEEIAAIKVKYKEKMTFVELIIAIKSESETLQSAKDSLGNDGEKVAFAKFTEKYLGLDGRSLDDLMESLPRDMEREIAHTVRVSTFAELSSRNPSVAPMLAAASANLAMEDSSAAKLNATSSERQ